MAKPYELHPSPIQVAPEDQALILEALLVFPLERWLEENWTADREEYWFQLMLVNRRLHYVLLSSFESSSITVNEDWDKKTLKLYEAERDYCLSLYQLAQQGWDAIAADQARSDWGDFSVFSPGDLVASAIALDCMASFSACLDYFEFRTTGAYDLYREGKKVGEIAHSGRDLTHSEQAKVNSHREKVKAIRKPSEPFFLFVDHVFKVCTIAAEHNQQLRHSVLNFLTQAERRHEVQMRRMPETQSFAWDKGNKLQAQRYGGVYRSS